MDEQMQPVEPAQQPVSMHDTPHKHHGALPLIAAMLGVFLVIESIVLGYVVTEYVLDEQEEVEADVQSTSTLSDELEEQAEEIRSKVPPLLYTDSGFADGKIYSLLKQVNRQTGQEQTIYTAKGTDVVSLLAVPQIGYDGHIFINLGCGECDSSGMSLYVLDLGGSKEVVLLPVVEGTLYRGSVDVSPDQTKIAIAQYEDVDTSSAGEIIVYDLLSGETEVMGVLAEGEYFSRYFGPNSLAGAGDFNVTWRNRECFTVAIYDEPTPAADLKHYKEIRSFCTE